MILCKTENFPGGSGTFRTCAFRQYLTGSAGLKDGFSVCHMDRPLKNHHKKTSCKSHPSAALQHGHYDECQERSRSQILRDSDIIEPLGYQEVEG